MCHPKSICKSDIGVGGHPHNQYVLYCARFEGVGVGWGVSFSIIYLEWIHVHYRFRVNSIYLGPTRLSFGVFKNISGVE